MAALTWPEVSARRLYRHGLAEPWADATPADVAAAMCGAHAQVMSAAELSIGIRTVHAARSDVRNALWSEHSLVKAIGPRGTVHLLPTRDLPMWTGALSALPAGPSALPPEAVLTDEQTESVVEAIGRALADAELTVDELTDAVVERTGPWAGDPVVPAWYGMWPRWRPALYAAATRGVVCFGPNRGRTVTYTNPHRYLPGFEPLAPSAALAELVRRYLHAYGPATAPQFARWLAAPRAWASELFDSLAPQLDRVDLDGSPAWLVRGDTEVPKEPADGVRLLPYFDAYAVGSQPRELLFAGRAYERALAGGQAGNYPVLLVDGTVAGVWHQKRSGRRVLVTVEPIGRLTAKVRRRLDAQVARIGEFVDARAELVVGTVTVGPHA